MHGIVYIAPRHRVVVDVLQLLPHHLLALDLLGTRPFLPNLVLAVHLVPCLVEGEQVEHGRVGFFQPLHDAPGIFLRRSTRPDASLPLASCAPTGRITLGREMQLPIANRERSHGFGNRYGNRDRSGPCPKR